VTEEVTGVGEELIDAGGVVEELIGAGSLTEEIIGAKSVPEELVGPGSKLIGFRSVEIVFVVKFRPDDKVRFDKELL
jgi:hypothetical protein